ncbi:mycothiol synthase [Murinocardiopsis flavida]|uniref:Mycothiol acetyltransferase n=1 Tax=Murinocardiopsis flavida TaxID=645275 RepID=A0A2P8DQV6_9ACTN|nr:mycothiol synthase [Murinocardiopsis flavida]PSK99590.1 mycothiol synthase [Murinocardiopsis flavida]
MSHVQITESLSPQQAEDVAALAEEARGSDGTAPISEQGLLRVRYGADPGAVRFHLLYEEAGDGPDVLRGFGGIERSPGEPDSAELVVAPEHRRRGLGGWLLRSLVEDAAPEGMRVWAHGDLPGAKALAAAAGLGRARSLWRMVLPLRPSAPVAEPPVSPELDRRVEIRPFRVGADDQAWLTVNARAFADHPEQGGITLADLRQRQAEPWFDPEGFFVAEDVESGALAGYHWTKTHADGAGLTDGAPAGEVYAVGVDPDWHGMGLGRTLTATGLRHLERQGLTLVLLYVDEDNRAAVRLYESLGFTLADADVMYRTPGTP